MSDWEEKLVHFGDGARAVSPGLLLYGPRMLRDMHRVERVLERFCRKYHVYNYDFYAKGYPWGQEEGDDDTQSTDN